MSDFGYNPEKRRNKPEFIILEDDFSEKREFFGAFREEEDILQSFQKISRKQYPFSLRFVMLFSSLISFILSIFAVIILVLALFINCIVFFQVTSFQKFLQMIWRCFRRIVVFTLGFFVAIFSPPFGFGLIMLYFMFYADRIANQFLKKMMQ